MAAYRPRAFALKLASTREAPQVGESTPLELPFNVDVTSTGKGQHDGAFDSEGRTIPGELLPESLISGGVTFQFGPRDGNKLNAVAAEGQALNLPQSAGSQRLYIVAAADGGDLPATFSVDGKPVQLTVQNWGGFIGQWDNRIWKGEVPLKTFAWTNELGGLAPGFIKRQPVAWYSDHWRLANGDNDPYRFCYLFRYAVDLPAGAKEVRLPNDRRIRIMAASLQERPSDVRAAQPLYDTMKGHLGFKLP